MRRHDRPGWANIGFVECRKTRDAEKGETDRDLVLEDFEQAHDAGGARGCEPVDIETAGRNRVGAEYHRLHHIGAAADPTIDNDPGAPADRLDDLRQHIDRAEPVVELTPAMVRDVNAVDAELDGAPGVF